jgi:tetratricopeptide (TPR) repeat protein
LKVIAFGSSQGAGDGPVGRVDKGKAILLDNAIPYFTSRIERGSKGWDGYLRRAESEHALNQCEDAIADDTRAIALHPDEPFLFLRRGREFWITQACPQAAADFDEPTRLKPQWAEAYNLPAGVYVDCPDPARPRSEGAIALIEHAIALSANPTHFTILGLAYFRAGNLERAVVTQRQTLETPEFPPGYREEDFRQLQGYESALAARSIEHPSF